MGLDDDECGCGISTVWMLRSDHPFITACKWHDIEYDKQAAGIQDLTRKEVDSWFYDKMLYIAKRRFWLNVQAFMLYRIVRLFGWIWW